MSEPLAPWDRGARILGVPQLISCYNHQKNCFLSSGIFGHKNLLILPRVQQHSEMPIVSLQRRWAVVERDRSKTRNTKNSHNYKNAATVRFIIAGARHLRVLPRLDTGHCPHATQQSREHSRSVSWGFHISKILLGVFTNIYLVSNIALFPIFQ